MVESLRIAVIGLGYVGLPLAVVLARSFETIGLDIDADRIEELREGYDRTAEVTSEVLRKSSLRLTCDPNDCRGYDAYIITVPTPVDRLRRPDLRPVISATRTVASLIEPGSKAVVVYESTVYPGVTEDLCGPELERYGGLRRGVDFVLGYSPERINPGDRQHTVDRITKIVSGEDTETLDLVDALYSKVTSGGTFRAASIKAAEAAKVIENAQRDINIAFINEITQIFAELDLSIWDVLDAARTKWNFLDFRPGLVGGHCIGVDPYYLAHVATEHDQEPRVILAGRAINDGMGVWLAEKLHDLQQGRAGTVLMMGLTFKENVPDIRNSKVIDVIRRLQRLGHSVTLHDPLAASDEFAEEYGETIDASALDRSYDLVVCAVNHDAYRDMSGLQISGLVKPGGLVADIKNIWGDRGLASRWTL